MSVADILLDAEQDIQAWTPEQCEARMRAVAARLREAIGEQRDWVQKLGEAEANYRRIYHKTHLESCLDPARSEWTVKMHESWAETQVEEDGEWGSLRIVSKEMKAALRGEIDALRSILEVLRSHNANARELAGGTRNR